MFVATALLCAGCTPPSNSPMLAPHDIELTAEERQAVAAGQQPESAFVGRLQGPREVVDGQTLNAKFQYLLELARPNSTAEAFEAERAAFATPAGRGEARAATDRRWRIHTLITAEMRTVEDRTIVGRDGNAIPVRI